MYRLYGIILMALVATACSADEREPQPTTEQAATADSSTADAPVPGRDGPPAEDADSVALAQAMDDTESEGASDAETLDEPIRLAADDEAASATTTRFREGVHYRALPVAQPTSAPPDKVEVVEVFWYGCPHCYTLEPHVNAWRDGGMPANAAFVRMPAALNRGWQVHARVFFAAEAMGVLDQVHEDLFREIHVNRNFLNTEEALIEFFGRYDISETQFLEAFNSFAVAGKLKRADNLVRRYRITGVPAMVVNGKYVTGADMAGGENELFEVLDYLIARESG